MSSSKATLLNKMPQDNEFTFLAVFSIIKHLKWYQNQRF